MANESEKKLHATKRTPFERERDLALIADYYVKGYRQHEIAQMLPTKLSRTQVTHDIKKIRRKWITSQVMDFNEAKNKELDNCDKVESAAWGEWERSKTKKVVKYSEKRSGTVLSEGVTIGEKTKISAREEEQTGDPRYLLVINQCRRDRMEILGLIQAKAFSVSGAITVNLPTTLKEKEARLAEIITRSGYTLIEASKN